MFREYGVRNIFLYGLCRVFGHRMQEVGLPIFHKDEGLIEQDVDCSRCGLMGTNVSPSVVDV